MALGKFLYRPSETVKDVMEKQEAFISYLQGQRRELSDRLAALSQRLETYEARTSQSSFGVTQEK